MADEIKVPQENKPEIKMVYEDMGNEPEQDKLVDDFFGLIPTTTTTPTHSPRKMIDQMRIEGSSIWFYDQANSTWFNLTVDAVYGGYVSSGSAGTPFPTGWSVSNPSTGNYQVTHNLGHSSYTVTITPTSVVVPNITSRADNTFNVNFRNLSAADTNANFHFILTDES